jgi:hypothetical protein
MIYRVLLQGGLGNQLFQVAAGTFLKENLGKQVKFDATLLTKVPKKIRLREIEIDWLIDDSELDRSSILTLGSLFLEKIPNNFVLKEKNLNDKVLERITTKSKFINGYFQNHDYVDRTWPKLGPKIIEKINQSSRSTPFKNNYVAVHFRGGDYLSDEKTRHIHGVTGFNYFTKGIKMLTSELNINKVVFVTDSPEFLRENLSEFRNLQTTIASSDNIFEDLAVISNSSGVVMSNSSFSWWGAFIANKISNAKIIAPTPWFTGKIAEPLHLIPKHWSVLERDIF